MSAYNVCPKCLSCEHFSNCFDSESFIFCRHSMFLRDVEFICNSDNCHVVCKSYLSYEGDAK